MEVEYKNFKVVLFLFFMSVFFVGTGEEQDSRGREEAILIPLYHLHPFTNVNYSFIYLQFCIWHD